MMNKASRAVSLSIFAAVATNARAGTPDQDKRWAALIAAAQNRGGAETKLEKTASYVFQQEDGAFVTLTRALTNGKRFVCLVAKDSKASVCVDWDTSKTYYGARADAASPWKTHEGPTLDELAADQPGPLGKLMSFVNSAIHSLPKTRGYSSEHSGH
jgi:hypothetical protein